MIITVLGVLALQAVEPASALCNLTWTQRGRRWTPAIICPTDVPDAEALQAVANTVLNPGRLRIESYSQPPDIPVEFEQGTQGWDLKDIVPIYRKPPSFPSRAFENYIAARCRGTVTLRANGRYRSGDWVCRTQNAQGEARASGAYIRNIREAIRDSYWIVPQTDANPCVEMDYEFNLRDLEGTEIMAPEFPASEGPQCPD